MLSFIAYLLHAYLFSIRPAGGCGQQLAQSQSELLGLRTRRAGGLSSRLGLSLQAGHDPRPSSQAARERLPLRSLQTLSGWRAPPAVGMATRFARAPSPMRAPPRNSLPDTPGEHRTTRLVHSHTSQVMWAQCTGGGSQERVTESQTLTLWINAGQTHTSGMHTPPTSN